MGETNKTNCFCPPVPARARARACACLRVRPITRFSPIRRKISTVGKLLTLYFAFFCRFNAFAPLSAVELLAKR
jgi:hypothetical protein